MGYTSVIRADATVIVDLEAREENDALQSRASAFGSNVKPVANANGTAAEIVSKYLKDKSDYIGYFLFVDEDAGDEVELEATGESGKAYEFDADIEELANFLDSRGLLLNGTFIRAGENNGDVQRIIVVNNKITNNEVAKLVFADGTEYNG